METQIAAANSIIGALFTIVLAASCTYVTYTRIAVTKRDEKPKKNVFTFAAAFTAELIILSQ